MCANPDRAFAHFQKGVQKMSSVPVTIHATVYPKDKSVRPYPATIVGMASITGLSVGGGPVLPPEEVPPVEPPLVIWPNPPEGQAPLPSHPIVLPDPIQPPEKPPAQAEPPHEGWNWSQAKSGWYYLYVPGEGQAGPKKR
jgi:hypothetical protein